MQLGLTPCRACFALSSYKRSTVPHTVFVWCSSLLAQGDGPSTSSAPRVEHTRAAIISVESDYSQVGAKCTFKTFKIF